MVRIKRQARRDPNTPLPTIYYSGKPTLTDLPDDYKKKLLNTLPQKERGRLSKAVRGFNEIEREFNYKNIWFEL